jgi:uncharacterized protein (DUF983 family)
MANIKDYDPNKNTRCPSCGSERSIKPTDYGNIYLAAGRTTLLAIGGWLLTGTLLWIPIIGWALLPFATIAATVLSALAALCIIAAICVRLFAGNKAKITRQCTALNCGWTGTLKAARQAWTQADSRAISTAITFE